MFLARNGAFQGVQCGSRRWIGQASALVCALGLAGSAVAQEPLTGSLNTHDPSTMVKYGDRYYSFNTGVNISSKYSTNRLRWTSGPTVFTSSTRPAWIATAVPDFVDTFWAPDIILLNGVYHLYYSCSSFGSQVSAIGLVTNPSLDSSEPSYQWTDQGAVIQSSGSVNYNAIDPSVLLASDGRLWMTFGSFWDGIKMIELDPATGKRISAGSTVYSLARHLPSTAIEGSCLIQHSNYYYLFVNWDTCCSGLDSTYQIRVGRSTSVTGPYLDRNNVSLASGGGSLFLEGTSKFIGPGHMGVYVEGETNWFTYHYYDGTTANGTSRLGMGRFYWSDDDWPETTNDWCAFYPFEADAREHRRTFDGTLRNGAAVTDEPDRSRVLALDGVSQYVTLPLSVANASTFAVWVKWNGGSTGQRILDFGTGPSRYFYLTPASSAGGTLRFAITTNGSAAEKFVQTAAPLPTDSWCHVAVTLDGSRGFLYLNGKAVATNNSLTIRPWQARARTNYVGKSQSTLDPLFSGRVDSLRIYGRALDAGEIQDLAEAHPSLAHRYSFNGDASDALGTAHGRLDGGAVTTGGELVLSGTVGDDVSLPGGLVSGCSAVTLEFWATFGTNGNWARVFDFGASSGGSGQNFLFFSPHTGSSSHRFTLSTTGGTRDHDVAGTFDGRAVHVACIADPDNGYTAIYTNGVLESEISGSLASLSGVSTSLAWLGHSLFDSDAWLSASIDEFRIYHGRLTPGEIQADYVAGPDTLALPVSLACSGSAGEITLSWPAYAAGYQLESTASLGAGSNWGPETSTVAIQNNRFQITLPATDQTRFFRLKR